MSNPALVYKATNYELVKDWYAALDEKWQKFQESCNELQDEIGYPIVTQTQDFGRAKIIFGYVINDGDAPLSGFRRDAKTGYATPDKRTKRGKEWLARLDGLTFQMPHKPGLPDLVWGAGRFGIFGMHDLDGSFFATLSFDPKADGETDRNTGMSELDGDLWKPAPLSEYHAAKEAAEAAA